MFTGRVQPGLLVVLAGALFARADTIKLPNKPPFRQVQIVGMDRQRVVFRGLSGQYLVKPLGEVEWLAMDRYPRLTVPEQAAARGEWVAAADGYSAALAEVREAWLRELVGLRLLRAADLAGRFDEAVATFLRLLESDPDVRPPVHPGPAGSDVNRRARTALEGAARHAAAPAAERVRGLLLELLIYEDVQPLPPELAAPIDNPKSFSALEKPRSAHEAVGLFPPEREGTDRPARAERPPVTSRAAREELGLFSTGQDDGHSDSAQAAGPPALGAYSLLMTVAHRACTAGDYREAARLLERGLPYVSADERPQWLLIFNRARLEIGAAADAASELMKLTESDPESPLAVEALLHVGLAHERLGRDDIARKVYTELQLRPFASEDLKRRARESLARLDAREMGGAEGLAGGGAAKP